MSLLRKSGRLPWYAWVFIVPWCAYSVMVLSHPIRGGTRLPPPMWTEADLTPVPADVAAALGPASEKSEALRFLERHRPLARSAEDALEQDPAAGPATLAKLFNTSVGCANSARSLTAYQVCASSAATDLDLIARSVKASHRGGDSDANDRLIALLRGAPALSVENSMIGEYVSSYQWLDSMLQDFGWKFLIITDLSATVSQLDNVFRSASAEDGCATLEGIMPSPFASLFTYNIGGRNFLSSVELTFCTFLPRAQQATETVAQKRRTLLDALGSDP